MRSISQWLPEVLKTWNSALTYLVRASSLRRPISRFGTKKTDYSLEFRVDSDCDSVLLINTGAMNYYFDDDDNGNFDPKIRLTRPSEGWYDVWIGTYNGSECTAVLTLETFD
jgi:hypothetical protein